MGSRAPYPALSQGFVRELAEIAAQKYGPLREEGSSDLNVHTNHGDLLKNANSDSSLGGRRLPYF